MSGSHPATAAAAPPSQRRGQFTSQRWITANVLFLLVFIILSREVFLAPSMSAPFLKAIAERRSIYELSASSPIPDAKIVEIVRHVVKHTPSAFNSQSSRAVVAFGEHHHKVWGAARTAMKSVMPEQAFESMSRRIDGFEKGYGTVLLFQDRADIQKLQAEYPPLAERFPISSQHTHGMVSGFIWTALAAEGLGVNIQHFNPQINEAVAKAFGTPESWTLTAQLVFGKKEGEPEDKSFKDSEEAVKVFGAKV